VIAVCCLVHFRDETRLYLIFVCLYAKFAALVWSSDDLIPPSERYIFNFNSKDELKRWHLYSDSEYGGIASL
jgi:hypothetical protein